MCFQCCHRHINDNNGNYCHGHSKEEKQYNDDEVLVDLALSGKAKKKQKFYHYEEKLQDKGQTCVIWCLKDFCQNKKWSGDVFQKEKLDRERKLRELTVADRIVLNTLQTVINNHTGRNFLIIYAGSMHLFVFLILYYNVHYVHRGCDTIH